MNLILESLHMIRHPLRLQRLLELGHVLGRFIARSEHAEGNFDTFGIVVGDHCRMAFGSSGEKRALLGGKGDDLSRDQTQHGPL